MLGKTFDFLLSVAVNGFFAIFIAGFLWFILGITFSFAMIPVSIIAGDDTAQGITNFAREDVFYKIIYAIVFISMLMDDLGVPSIKTIFKRWQKKNVG